MAAQELSKKELASELDQRIAEIESLKIKLQQAENEILANKKWQEALLENPLVGIGLSNGNRILHANRPLLELFGYFDLNEFLSIPLIEHIAPSSRAVISNRPLKSAAGIPDNPTLIVDIRRKDGSKRTLEVNVVPCEWNRKHCQFILFRDLTEPKRAQAAFRDSESKYRALVETTNTGYVILDPEGRVLDANPEYVRLTGHRALFEILGHMVVEWTAPYDIPRNVEEVRKCVEQGFVRNLEVDYVDRAGKVTPIEVNATTLETAEGKWIVTLCRDISERKAISEALRASEEYLNLIINCIGDPIFVKDRERAFVLVNEAFCRLIGKQREDLLGKRIHELLPKKQSEVFSEQEDMVFKTGKERINEEVFIDANGEMRTNMTRTTMLRDKAGDEQIVGIMRDITELKRLEAQFLQSQKMEAIGVLAGGVAHDFNNLLSVINGYSELLMRHLGPDHVGNQDLEQIRQAGRQAASLTSQLLAFSRRQILRPEIIDLNEVVSETCNILHRIIGENIKLTVLAQPDLGYIKADPSQIEQVIMNLAVNARDAMPKGGWLTIETANVFLDEAHIRELSGSCPGPHVMLSVSDNGAGMDSETQGHIFEPFFTTKRIGKGTGLGLSTVYGIVKQSNGFIEVKSELEKGTAFKIYLPQAQLSTDLSNAAGMNEVDLSGTETVLLAEDDAAIRGMAARVLRDQGYRVIEAANGKEALQAAQEFDGEIHLILTDVVMPGMSGPEFVAQIKLERPEAKVLFVSGYTSEDIIQNGLLDLDINLLPKPLLPGSLAHKVREVIGASR